MLHVLPQITLSTLRYRLFHALPNNQGQQPPAQPFNVLNVQSEGATTAAPAAAAPAQRQQAPVSAPASRQRTSSGFHQVANGSSTNVYSNYMYMYVPPPEALANKESGVLANLSYMHAGV